MKTFRELYFIGSEQTLKEFINSFSEYVYGNWSIKCESNSFTHWLYVDYLGNQVNKASVCISISDSAINSGELKVNNIVPLEKSELSIDEYNSVLMEFYNDIIKPYKEKTTLDIQISEPTDDEFNPLTVISEKALNKLKSFCNSANKSTGSSHPYDQERWFDFICQTVDDGKEFGYDELAKFLQDESYWGKKNENGAWSEEHAYKLALEYESLCSIVKYYKIRKEYKWKE